MKLIYKPGLIAQIKDRLKFCLSHKDLKLEDWKNIIWTNKTSVILSYRLRGYCIWRTPEERFLKSTTSSIYTSHHRELKSIFHSSLLPNLERQELIMWRFGDLLVAQGGVRHF